MEKIRLGKTKLMISRLGFGGIPIQRVSEDEAIAVVRKCLELGITFIDTANAYGNSEERIGKAIAGRRDGLVLATKTTSITATPPNAPSAASGMNVCPFSVSGRITAHSSPP